MEAEGKKKMEVGVTHEGEKTATIDRNKRRKIIKEGRMEIRTER